MAARLSLNCPDPDLTFVIPHREYEWARQILPAEGAG
jgi:hypothetical protein